MVAYLNLEKKIETVCCVGCCNVHHLDKEV